MMWKITMMYHTVNKVTGKMNPIPKFKSKFFHTREECKVFELYFHTSRRVIMWTYIERYAGYLDDWLK